MACGLKNFRMLYTGKGCKQLPHLLLKDRNLLSRSCRDSSRNLSCAKPIFLPHPSPGPTNHGSIMNTALNLKGRDDGYCLAR